MWICSMGTMDILHVQCEPGLSQKGRREGDFSAKFSGIIIFSLELYLGDQLCSKCKKKVLSVTWLTRYRHIKIIS